MTGLETHDVPDAVEPTDWELDVTGAVSRPLRLDLDELMTFPVEVFTGDFECVDGWVAADLSWRGVRVADVLDRASPTVEDGYVLVRAMDTDYACSFPKARVADALLAVGLDGDELPVEHGGPVRLVPTGSGSDCWESVKWVSELEVSASEPAADDTARERALGDPD